MRTPKLRTTRRLVAVFAGAALVATACGSDDDAADEAPDSTDAAVDETSETLPVSTEAASTDAAGGDEVAMTFRQALEGLFGRDAEVSMGGGAITVTPSRKVAGGSAPLSFGV